VRSMTSVAEKSLGKVVDTKRLNQTLRQTQGEERVEPHAEPVEASSIHHCPQP
jgi:hypothetical protein